MSIEGIYCDQWFGVRAGRDLREDEVFVACDQVEHGLAAIWKHHADRDSVAVGPSEEEPNDE